MKTTLTKKAVIIEDYKLIAEIWQSILEGQGISTLQTFDNADDIANEIIALSPDIVLMDINLKGKVDGLQLTSKLKSINPSIRVLVITMHDTKSYMLKAQEAGAHGYISKSSSIAELKQAIETVLKDEFHFNSLLLN